jgi:Flp pilus assembly protein TadD/peroxiredoxin
LRQLAPGTDAYPEERDAADLGGRLDELGRLLREGRSRDAVEALLAPDFRGTRLAPSGDVAVSSSPALAIVRAIAMPRGLSLDRSAFAAELAAFVEPLGRLRVAELLITALEVAPDGTVRTAVRYDLAGADAAGARSERIGRWSLAWRRTAGAEWRVVAWAATADTRSRAPRPIFSDVTEEALAGNACFRGQLARGLDAWIARLDGSFLPSGMGHHGVSAGDYDGDGRDDLYVCQPAGLPGRLLRNRGDGTFEDATEKAGLGVLDNTSQALFADVENDGDQDLVLVARGGLLLFVNDGAGRFALAKDAFRVRGALSGSPTSIAMADYDRDGFLDLYLCTYSHFIGASEDKAGTPTPYHDARNGPADVLFRNDGRGRFVDATTDAGLTEGNDGFGFAAAWGDYDDDGWPDLLVANDFGRKNLYHNEGLQGGKVRFRDVAKAAGVLDYGAGMSAAFLDYDNDGRLDIYTGNMWTAAGLRVTGSKAFKPDAPPALRELYRRHARGNSLFRNRGDGTFEDVSLAARAEMGRWAWSSDTLDFDSDGSPDLYVVNGMFTRDAAERDTDLDSFFWRQVVAVSPLDFRRGTAFDDAWRATNRLLAENGSQARHERNVLLRNDGHGEFDEVSGSAGLDLDQDGRSFAVLDYDQDGDPDLAVMAARQAPQLRIFRNDFEGRKAALAVRLTGRKGNRDAIGARVTVETNAMRRTKQVQAGSGFISQHSKELLFGLGASERVVKLEVRWPGGETQTFADVALGHRVLVQEGDATPRSEPFRAAAGGAAAAPAASGSGVASEGGPSGTWLYRPFPAPEFALRGLDGAEHSLAGLRGRPAVLLFWSLAVPSSRDALADLARARGELAKTGAAVLAVSVDGPADEAPLRAAAAAGVPVARATEEMAGSYSVLSRFLFDRREDLRLPTALLLDARGAVVKVYRDRIDAALVAADVPKIEAPSAERLARAVPFGGSFQSPPGERNYFQYALDLAEQGFDAASLAAFEQAAALDPSAITFYNLGTLYSKAARSSQAERAFERALTLEPGHAESCNSLGALLAQRGDLPGAIARFREALQGRPDFPDALNNLGYALYQAGDDKQPLELYRKALALRPDFAEASNNLGIYFGEQGDLAQAEKSFREAIAHRPGYGEGANNLALVLAARGDFTGAIEVLQRLLEEAPGFEPGYLALASVYAQAGRRKEAVQVLELLLQRNPSHPAGLELLRKLRTS